MDKRQITALVVTVLAVTIFWAVRWKIEQAHPEWAKELDKQAQPATQPTTAPTVAPGAVGTMPASQPAVYSGSSTAPSIGAIVGLHEKPTTQTAQVVVLGSDAKNDSTYALALALSPRGAALESVTLNQFRQAVKREDRYVFQQPYTDEVGTEALATRFVTVNGVNIDLSGDWQLSGNDSDSATYTKDIVDGETPVMRISRTYRVEKRSSASAGYEIQADYSFQNLSNKALKVATSFNGPTVPPKEVERGADRQVIAGYEQSGSLKLSQLLVESIKESQDIGRKDNAPALWAGTGSVYFSALVLPGYSGTAAPPNATKLDYAITAKSLTPDDPERYKVQMTFTSSAFDLAPGQSALLPLSVFLGPKQRELVGNSYYASFPREFNQTLVIPSKWCGACTFSPLIAALVFMLGKFHTILFHDWGLAIICLVVLVRICLHPITKRSQVQMMRMGKMGPEIERLKAKYGDNKDALNKAMMQVYKEQGMAPVLGCLPMFLQMPIWIALWSALQSTFELRQSPFLWFGPVHLTWISDLANPDALISWTPFTLPIIGAINSLNVLPILMGVVFFMQQKYTPKPVATTPEQAQQQKMMMWMSTALFPLFLYKSPAGLNLYIFASTTYGIIESKIIRKHIKEREELEKKQRTIIDVKPTRASKYRIGDEPEPSKPTGIMGWLANLQAKADQIKREQK